MSEPIIKVHKLGKRYRIGTKIDPKGRDNFRDAILNMFKAPFKNFKRLRNLTNFDDTQPSALCPSPDIIWALKDVSFEINKGDVVGIIGRNGSGKSTLLKILSRITEPTEGYAELRGRVASLLEVGTGFHRELTGRENIYLNGSTLGMKKWEIDAKFDEIVAFSEIEKFIDTPVKHYSSGMYVRLAFAVAAHLEPEILLVDEVLAVGDMEFQKKCLGKMNKIAKGGKTVLFVSHNMAAIENLCERIILLQNGNIIQQGYSKQVINYYLETILSSTIDGIPLYERKNRSGNGKIKLTGFHIEDVNGNKLSAVRSGIDVMFVFDFRCKNKERVKNVDVGLSISSDKDQRICVLYSSYLGIIFDIVVSTGSFCCFVPKFPLSPGRYRIDARLTVGGEEADCLHDGVGYIDVEIGDFYGTGRRGFDGSTHFLVNGIWKVREYGKLNADSITKDYI